MIINYDGKSYEWDQDVEVSEDSVIFAYTGLHFLGWTEAMDDPSDPKFVPALQGLMWMLKKRAGEVTDIKAQNFKIGGFIKAIREANALETPEDDSVPKESQPSDLTAA